MHCGYHTSTRIRVEKRVNKRKVRMVLKRVTLLALTLGTIGLMAESEAESGLLPIPLPPSIESSAVRVMEVVQVQEIIDAVGQIKQAEQTNRVEGKAIQEEDLGPGREIPQDQQRSEEPRQPDGVAKPNLPANAPTPPKQISELPKTKPAFNRNKQGNVEEFEEPSEKLQTRNKNKDKNDSDNNNNGEKSKPSNNYTVPKRRSQTQQNDAIGEAIPGSVIGALVLFLVIALMQ